ncbi:PREDICTED: uncharacterized protein LOC109166122 [Ipomoea nil]|uniref:uncharacterized protein LOC109166122 n=1 Tax=Ipomoea nil TaxID=35883 RepID=UPI0009010389|nr:PREDICTED: uncharacterized protein LOC109166122 [Ipomoea nil]
MASVALTSLIATMKLEFLQPNNPRVSLDDEASISINSLFENLSSLQAFLQKKSGAAAIRDLEVKIRYFALEAEDHIKIQLSNFLLAKKGEDQQKASQQLNQTLGEAAENAADLLKISNEASADDDESQRQLIPWIKHSLASEPSNVMHSLMVGRHRDLMQIEDKLVRNAYGPKVITILGMIGIGKTTTLAKHLYNHPNVTSHFDIRGWVTISGEYNKTQTLYDLLWTLTMEANIHNDDDAAAQQVYNFLREWFEGLDYVVSTNRNLQTLVISGKESQLGASTLCLPCTIWESPHLQHLELDKSYEIDPPSMDKDIMQTLSWVCPTHCRTKEMYCRFPNIKKLKFFVFGSNPIVLDTLEYLERLEKLSISVWVGCIVTLPKPSMFPSQLKKLRLNGTNLSERDLMVIGMLPQLEVLKLENTFHEEIWDVDEGRFSPLKFLLLENKTLRRWPVEIPYVLEDTVFLKSIELQQCCRALIASAEGFLEYKREIGNENFENKSLETISVLRKQSKRLKIVECIHMKSEIEEEVK